MRTAVAALLIVCLILAGCGQSKTIDGVTYNTYGLLNEDNKKNPDIQYEAIVGNIVWSVILVETIIAPIYFFGFDLFEPICKKPKPEIKGYTCPERQ